MTPVMMIAPLPLALAAMVTPVSKALGNQVMSLEVGSTIKLPVPKVIQCKISSAVIPMSLMKTLTVTRSPASTPHLSLSETTSQAPCSTSSVRIKSLCSIIVCHVSGAILASPNSHKNYEKSTTKSYKKYEIQGAPPESAPKIVKSVDFGVHLQKEHPKQ